MILMFTSEHCMWCDLVRTMLRDEMKSLMIHISIHEVDVNAHEPMTAAYGILSVPTLVTSGATISGLPTRSDLRSFLLQALAGAIDSEHAGMESLMNIVRESRRRSRIMKSPITL